MKEFELNGEYIKLDQLLKAASLVSSGGEAKILILSELVKVNGEVVTQRGKKIHKGDVVAYEGEQVKIV